MNGDGRNQVPPAKTLKLCGLYIRTSGNVKAQKTAPCGALKIKNMKNLKNLIPLFALLLGFGLVITQSAFTTQTTYQTPTEDLFWYEVEYDGTQAKISSSITHVGDKTSYPTPPCDDTDINFLCVIGSSNPNLQINDNVSMPGSASERILKTQLP